MDEMLCNSITVFFNRLGTWFLSDMSLANYCCNRTIFHNDYNVVTVGMINIEPATIEEKCRLFDVPFRIDEHGIITVGISGTQVFISIYTPARKGWLECNGRSIRPEWIACPPDTVADLKRKRSEYMGNDGLWTIPVSQLYPQTFNVPYMVGTLLDATVPDWFKRVPRSTVNWGDWGIHDLFFDEPRKVNGYDLLKKLYECGAKAGIDNSMFCGFGTLLGVIRHNCFLAHDRDMDMCVLADNIMAKQSRTYAFECQEAGLDEHRWRPPEVRPDTGMAMWFSLGPKNPVSDNGVKCCQWFWFRYGGYWWHTKGGQWVNPNKFSPNKTSYTPNDAAICKGIPEDCVEALIPYDFNGTKINIPTTPGRCLDNWYPGWPVPDTCASAHTHIMVIGDWNDKETWRIT